MKCFYEEGHARLKLHANGRREVHALGGTVGQKVLEEITAIESTSRDTACSIIHQGTSNLLQSFEPLEENCLND